MTMEWTEASLHQAARQMVLGLAAALPAEEAAPTLVLTEDLRLLSRRAARKQVWRRLGQRAAMVALTAALTFGAVLAVSPQARAAVGGWLFVLTENRALYRFFAGGDASTSSADYIPCCLPEGYTMVSDLPGGDGTRTVLYRSQGGDLLFRSFPLVGDGRTLEIRVSGLTDKAGQPTERLPQELTPEETSLHGMTAHFYRFPQSTVRHEEGYLLAFYAGGLPHYSVTLPEFSTALVWTDENAGYVFLLTGGLDRGDYVQVAESIYKNGGETA